MTDTDRLKHLIAATGHCSTGGCTGCPYDDSGVHCLAELMRDVHDYMTELINHERERPKSL